MQILDAAKYIIHLSYSVKSRSLTLSKLQAILYLAQGWSYVWDNAPLFEEDFIASELASGVINKTISHYFKDYFKWLIEIPEKYGCIPVAMTEEEKERMLKMDVPKFEAVGKFQMTEQEREKSRRDLLRLRKEFGEK